MKRWQTAVLVVIAEAAVAAGLVFLFTRHRGCDSSIVELRGITCASGAYLGGDSVCHASSGIDPAREYHEPSVPPPQ